MNEETLTKTILKLTKTTESATEQLLDMVQKAEQKIAFVENTARRLTAQFALIETENVTRAVDDFLEAFTGPINATIAEASAKLDTASFVVDLPAEHIEDDVFSAINEHADAISGFVDDVVGDFNEKFDVVEDMVDTVVEQLVSTGQVYQDSVSETLDDLKEAMGSGIPSLSQVVGNLFDSILSQKLGNMVEEINNVLDKLEEVVKNVVGKILGKIGDVMDVLETVNEIVQPFEPAFDVFEEVLG